MPKSKEDVKHDLVDSALLDKIDRLFACKAGEHVDLPQLVVVGDQSSGKSSVLEALTKLPFPRDSGLCTKFATQITFRRSRQVKVTAAIIPSKNSSKGHQDNAKAWTKTGLLTLDADCFAEIMREAAIVMGLEGIDDGGIAARTFSEDVLRLEIFGPTQEHFSVIDVPGIFKRTTQGVTTKEDIALVNNMVNGYMANSRSVMLTVVPCNVDIATQEILERAEEYDPEGNRTIGVLTKPDIVDSGAESAVLDLLEGRKHKLQLGWHILKNPGQAEMKNAVIHRDALESRFFTETSPWNTVDPDHAGISSLRIRLQEILTEHIRREFPKVRSEIMQQLKDRKAKLTALGSSRQSYAEQNRYLTEIATRFQRVAEAAIKAEYSREKLLDETDHLRLATLAINRGECFADDMNLNGNYFAFDDKQADAGLSVADAEKLTRGALEALETMSLEDNNSLEVRKLPDCLELEDVLYRNTRIPKPMAEAALPWLKTLYYRTRGFEIGVFDVSLLATAMKKQACKWKDLALGYVSDIIAMIHHFISEVLKLVAPEERLRQAVMSTLMDNLIKKYEAAINHTRFILDVELEGHPATYNNYFNENLTQCREARARQNLSDKTLDSSHGQVVRVSDIAAYHPMGNVDFTIQEVHDILRSYYRVAAKRFVDTVRMQVADHHLVAGKDSPLALFSPAFVAGLDVGRLEEIAGEDAALRRKRARLENEIGELQEAKAIVS